MTLFYLLKISSWIATYVLGHLTYSFCDSSSPLPGMIASDEGYGCNKRKNRNDEYLTNK